MRFWNSRKTPSPKTPCRRVPYRPRLEMLEDRRLLSGPGTLDPTFGSGGYVTTNFGKRTQDYGMSVAFQPDGKIIAAGATSAGPAFEVARYNPNGTLDSTFGSGGKVSTTLTPSPGSWTGTYFMVLQPDGKIVVAGQDSNSAELARYNTNGTPDTTFGPNHNGTLFLNFGPGINAVFRGGGLTLETVGGSPKIVAVVHAYTGGGSSAFGLARYNLDGSLDSTFGSGGEVITPSTTFFFARPQSSTTQADGKILVGGFGQYTYGGALQFVVARYDTSGNLDPGFGNGGYVIIPGVSGPTEADALAVQPDGKIVAGGYISGATQLVRLNVGVTGQPDGSLDATFGSGGIAADNNDPTSLAIQSNGRIVSAGNGSTVYRYNPDGSLDTGFGTAGGVAMPASGAGNAVALQTDGKIIAVGTSPGNNQTYSDFEVARFLGDPITTIGSFKAGPDSVASGSTTTPTVSNLSAGNPNSTVTQALFYNLDGNGTKQVLGYGTLDGLGNWTLSFTVGLAPGTYTLYAQAQDSYGVLGDPLALALTVQ